MKKNIVTSLLLLSMMLLLHSCSKKVKLSVSGDYIGCGELTVIHASEGVFEKGTEIYFGNAIADIIKVSEDKKDAEVMVPAGIKDSVQISVKQRGKSIEQFMFHVAEAPSVQLQLSYSHNGIRLSNKTSYNAEFRQTQSTGDNVLVFQVIDANGEIAAQGVADNPMEPMEVFMDNKGSIRKETHNMEEHKDMPFNINLPNLKGKFKLKIYESNMGAAALEKDMSSLRVIQEIEFEN